MKITKKDGTKVTRAQNKTVTIFTVSLIPLVSLALLPPSLSRFSLFIFFFSSFFFHFILAPLTSSSFHRWVLVTFLPFQLKFLDWIFQLTRIHTHTRIRCHFNHHHIYVCVLPPTSLGQKYYSKRINKAWCHYIPFYLFIIHIVRLKL